MFQVTWVEHTEYDANVVHQLYQPLLNSGLGFGAQKWVASLQRQCNYLAAITSSTIHSGDHAGVLFKLFFSTSTTIILDMQSTKQAHEGLLIVLYLLVNGIVLLRFFHILEVQLYFTLLSLFMFFHINEICPFWWFDMKKKTIWILMHILYTPVTNPAARRSIGQLAQRMTRSFCNSVCATVHKWELVQSGNADNTKLMMRESIGNPGEPLGTVLSAVTTVWLPISCHYLFDFLRNEQTRGHWDVLSQDGCVQQMLHIPKSQDLVNSISVLRNSVSGSCILGKFAADISICGTMCLNLEQLKKLNENPKCYI